MFCGSMWIVRGYLWMLWIVVWEVGGESVDGRLRADFELIKCDMSW